MIAIGRETLEQAQRTRSDNSLPYRMVPNPDGSIVDQYSGSLSATVARDGMYVIDTNGIVALERKTASSPAEALAALAALSS